MRRYSIFLLLALVWQFSRAQRMQLKFDHFTEKEGLPDPLNYFVVQDDLGYIWMGSITGMVRYDGYNIKRYQIDNRWHDPTVISSLSDSKNHQWFSVAGHGIASFNPECDGFTVYENPGDKENASIYNPICFDKQGNLWCERYAGRPLEVKIIKLDTKTRQFITYAKGNDLSVERPVVWVANDRDATVWMSDKAGLKKYDYQKDRFIPFFPLKHANGQKTIFGIFSTTSEPNILWLNAYDRDAKRTVIERLDVNDKVFIDYNHLSNTGLTAANDTVNKIYEDTKHRLWFATPHGLMFFNRQKKAFTSFILADTDKEAYKNQISKIAEDRDGSLWLISGKGLLNFNPETRSFKRYTTHLDDPDGLSGNFLGSILVDKAGILWVGNAFYGTDKLNPLTSIFRTYPIKVVDGSSYARGITNNVAFSADGFSWFANDQGIYKWKPGMDKPEGIYKRKKSDKSPVAIMVSRGGKVYFCNGHGLQVLDPVSHAVHGYTARENDTTSISGDQINNIFEDHTGLIWVGTVEKGLCSFNPATQRFKRYPYFINNLTQEVTDKLDDATIDCIYEDNDGMIWVGTLDGGLNCIDPKTGKIKSFLNYGGIHVHTVDHIVEDKDGRLWVGTFSLGLFEFDRKKEHYIRCFNEQNGLLINNVNGIAQGKDGYLLIGSPRGITRIDPQNWAMKTFPLKKILPGKSVLSDYNFFRYADRMMVILKNGVVLFDPVKLAGNPYPPIVHIENVAHSNPGAPIEKIVAESGFSNHQIELPYNQNRITFSYIALHYSDPSSNVYAYRLAGYDNHWIEASTQRSATYNNLSPGTYTFRVKAANSDGVWNNKGDSFVIIINPPWWQTWWAWALWIILFISAVYAFIAYRSRKLLHDKRVLEHKVQIRTEEVLQQKEEIEAQRDHLEKAFDDLKSAQTQLIQSEKMASLGELTAGIAHEIQNPLNFVNNFSEVSAELIDELDEELEKGDLEEVKTIAGNVKQNLEKIRHHGKRADGIVKGMLEHSRSSTGQKEPTDLNKLAEEYLRLAYHGLRAKNKNFNADLVTHFDETLPPANVILQDIGRVLLNLFNNAFYAVNQKAKAAGADYKPAVEVTTSTKNGQVVISVKDNGNGIPESIKDKIMQPFFTTKPTGEGTGLGLSLSYDIVVKGHGGIISVDTQINEYTEFIVKLPLQ